ncbi:hypothetical protein NMY22_g7331 [Coprinellus aureogranulatus]|nr:hypothetical protein NMY22_g7331 [Coprinellus aureogranulatus]
METPSIQSDTTTFQGVTYEILNGISRRELPLISFARRTLAAKVECGGRVRVGEGSIETPRFPASTFQQWLRLMFAWEDQQTPIYTDFSPRQDEG